MEPRGANRAEPTRTCIGCRERKPASTLVRLTRSAGAIAVGGPSNGRGAWLCRAVTTPGTVEPNCLETALARGAFARAWRGAVSAAECEAIRERLA